MKHPYDWKPVPQTVIRDEAVSTAVSETGYRIVPFLEPAELEALRALYARLHNIQTGEGGMFYSVYSKNVAYRQEVHHEINTVLQDAFARHLHHFQVMLNAFVIKSPGKKSEFNVHQDATGLDEFRYSPLSIWIPLLDITPQNGALCVMPKSHGVFSPYRSISFPSPYDAIQPAVKKYLHPLYLRAGEAIFFDNRLVHNSMANHTPENRPAVVSSVFPEGATLQTCFKDPADPEGKIEIIGHENRFLTDYTGFLENCHLRPEGGTTRRYAEDLYPALSEDDLEAKCRAYGILPYEGPNLFTEDACHMIGEPVADTAVSETAGETSFLRKYLRPFFRKPVAR